MKTDKGNKPLTQTFLKEMLAPANAGESQTFDGPIQIGAMQSRNRNGAVKLIMGSVLYTLALHPENPQQFYLLPEIGGITPKHGLSWGYMALSNAIEKGDIRYA